MLASLSPSPTIRADPATGGAASSVRLERLDLELVELPQPAAVVLAASDLGRDVAVGLARSGHCQIAMDDGLHLVDRREFAFLGEDAGIEGANLLVPAGHR